MAARRITAIYKRHVIYIRQVRVKHVELTVGYMEKLFINGSMTVKFHILKVHEGLGGPCKRTPHFMKQWLLVVDENENISTDRQTSRNLILQRLLCE